MGGRVRPQHRPLRRGRELPVYGYNEILTEICRRVLTRGAKDVLDIGFGTDVLTAMLYEHGCRIYGQDSSESMIALAQEKMPEATLVCGDFTQGLAMTFDRLSPCSGILSLRK